MRQRCLHHIVDQSYGLGLGRTIPRFRHQHRRHLLAGRSQTCQRAGGSIRVSRKFQKMSEGILDVLSFAFDYSTVDTYNTLTIHYTSGPDTVYTGTEILGGLPTGTTNGSITVNGDGRTISGLSLSTSNNAFEVDNLSFSASLASDAPEPASWALMLGGFGLIGGVMRSSRKAAVSFG